MSGSREAKHPRKAGRQGESLPIKRQPVQAVMQRASFTPKQPNWVGSEKERCRICWMIPLNLLMRRLVRSLTLLPQDRKQPRWRGKRQEKRRCSWQTLLLLHLGAHTISKMLPLLRIRTLRKELNGRSGKRCSPRQMRTKTRRQKDKVMKRAARRRILLMKERKKMRWWKRKLRREQSLIFLEMKQPIFFWPCLVTALQWLQLQKLKIRLLLRPLKKPLSQRLCRISRVQNRKTPPCLSKSTVMKSRKKEWRTSQRWKKLQCGEGKESRRTSI
mmetsp:Transcript_20835/g.34362  ORF Transcript_20835/g.34362 Transcript_20835/m.34362 type:complete len:273 (-) Transcript_20835:744-1562(-)